MFERGSDGVYRSSLLKAESWLDHGFASRHVPDWPGEYFRVRQIHSNTVALASEPGEEGGPQADAIITFPNLGWAGIRTADCVPVLLADPVRHCVAAVHAGWRGTVRNIVGEAVRMMRERCGSDPADLVAAIGPAIGHCCFEVGTEVSEEFAALFPEAANLRHVDLCEANRRQLVTAGLKRERIDSAGLCTRCDAGEFESWRRDREQSGRMVAGIRALAWK